MCIAGHWPGWRFGRRGWWRHVEATTASCFVTSASHLISLGGTGGATFCCCLACAQYAALRHLHLGRSDNSDIECSLVNPGKNCWYKWAAASSDTLVTCCHLHALFLQSPNTTHSKHIFLGRPSVLTANGVVKPASLVTCVSEILGNFHRMLLTSSDFVKMGGPVVLMPATSFLPVPIVPSPPHGLAGP